MFQYSDDCIYIAGPECFYPNGYDLWEAMGKKAEYYGFGVVMPTKNELKLDNEDLRKNADVIFKNCARSMQEATAVVADLELFRGSEPDGGTLFELGMAFARGIRCYGFTRDKRDMVYKHQGLRLEGSRPCDNEGRVLPYHNLPFCSSLIGSTKLLEGGFEDCLKLLMLDIDEERKNKGRRLIPATEDFGGATAAEKKRPLVYLSGPERFLCDAAELYARMKEQLNALGMDAVTPLDEASGVPAVESDDAYTMAAHQFDSCQQHIRNCDILLADLNDFHGYEPSSDVAFECGMAWQLGKQCFGYMSDARRMVERIPNLGKDTGFLDYYGCVVENFDYPINLMFASSMPILQGDFASVLPAVAANVAQNNAEERR